MSVPASLGGASGDESVVPNLKADREKHPDRLNFDPEANRAALYDDLDDDNLSWSVDPENPRNWRQSKKWISVGIVSFYTLFPPLASSMMAPGLPQVAIKYHITNPTVLALTLSVFLTSFALGPLAIAPLSEMYGRTWLLHIANILTLGFSLGCAFAPTTGSFIAFRFLSGLSGSAPLAIGGGTVSDVFAEHERAAAMAVYTLGPLLGPAIGPVAGGFIAQYLGLEWVFIIIAILCGVASLVGIPFLRETYDPVIHRRQASKILASPNPNPAVLAAAEKFLASDTMQKKRSKGQAFWLNISRPIMLLTTSLICFMLSLYMAYIFGILYLLFATFPDIFNHVYGFNSGVGGLAYLGLGIGFLIATLFGAKIAARIFNDLTERNNGAHKPEFRVPPLIFASFLAPIGLLWFGWSAQAAIHWIMPIIGSGIFGFAMMTSFLPILLYLVDAFTFAASAVAAASTFRSLLGFAFPLFGSQMFAKLTVGWGCTLLAGLAIVLGIPFPIWLYFKGEEMRKDSRLTR